MISTCIVLGLGVLLCLVSVCLHCIACVVSSAASCVGYYILDKHLEKYILSPRQQKNKVFKGGSTLISHMDVDWIAAVFKSDVHCRRRVWCKRIFFSVLLPLVGGGGGGRELGGECLWPWASSFLLLSKTSMLDVSYVFSGV